MIYLALVHEAVTLRKESIEEEQRQCVARKELMNLESLHLSELKRKLFAMECKLDIVQAKVRTNHHNQNLHKQVALCKSNVEFIDMTIVRKKNYLDLLSEMLKDKEKSEIQISTDCSLIIKQQHDM